MSETRTPLHDVDPRALLLATLALLVALAAESRHAVVSLPPFALFPLHLVVLGRIRLGLLGRRMLVALPFLAIMALPAPLLETQRVPTPWGECALGWFTGASLLGRGVIAISAALALSTILDIPRLGAGLRGLGCPAALVTQLSLLERYLLLLGDEATRIRQAARLRALAGAPGLRLAAAMLAALLGRSIDRAERIHLAMLQRGFTGLLPHPPLAPFRRADAVYLAGWLGFVAVLVLMRPFDGMIGRIP